MSIDHIVLGLISIQPCSGYDMKAEFEKSGVSMFSALSFGSIYPRLRQLEQAGLIETVQVNEHGRRKKVYELTQAGWLELRSWLGEQPAYPLPMRDDLLLGMLFWGAAGKDRASLIQHLQVRREESSGVLDYIDEWQKNDAAFVDEYTAIVMSYVRSKVEAELRWIAETIGTLEGEPSLPMHDPRWLTVTQKARRKQALELSGEENAG